MVTGRVARRIKTGDEVEIVGLSNKPRKTVVTGVEMFRKVLDYAEAGDNIERPIKGVDRGRSRAWSSISKAWHK